MAVRITDGALSWSATIDDTDLNRMAEKVELRVANMSKNVQAQGNEIVALGKKISVAAAGFFSLQAASDFVRSMVQVRSEFQQLEIAFSTILKSKSAADQLMKELIDFAGTTPFGLKEAAGAAKQLLAYGSTAKEVTSELRMLGDVASGVSAPISDLVYLYGTLKTQGRAYTKDIMQFAGRGIPIYAELAKVLGRNKDEIAGMVEAGKVGFKEVEQAFRNMTEAGGTFGGLMEKQSQTLTGQIERMKDAWDLMLNSMGQSSEGILYAGIEGITALIENYQQVLDTVMAVAGVYGVYKAALFATAAFEKASSISRMSMVVALNQESVARINNANAALAEMRANVSALAVKKAAATQAAVKAAAVLKEAQATTSNATATTIAAAQEKALATRKAAMSAASAFYTAKQQLETTAKVANSAATVELTAVEALNASGKRVLTAVTSAYNAVLAASPVFAFTAVVSALGLAIYSLTQITNAAEESQRVLNEAHEEGGKSADEEARKIEQLIEVIKNQNSTVDQKKAAYDKLQETTNGVLKGYNQEEIAAGKAAKSIDDYVKKVQEAVSARAAFAEFNELAAKMDELDRNGIKAVSTMTRLGRSLKNTFTPTSQGISLSEWGNELIDGEAAANRIVAQEKEVLNKAMTKLKEQFGGKFAEIISGTEGGGDEPKLKARTEKVIDKEIQDQKDARAEYAATSKAYADYTAKIKVLEEEKTRLTGKASAGMKKELNERQRFLERLTELEEEALRKGLTRNQEEIKAAQDKANELRREAQKNGLGAGVATRIDNYETNLTGAIRYRQETEELEKQLEIQKGLFSQFEDYKTRLNEDEANKRFGSELKGFKNYSALIQSELDKINQTPEKDLTGPQRERLKVLKTELDTFNRDKKAKEAQEYAEAYQAAITYNQRVDAINQEYRRKAITLSGALTDEQRANLLRQRDDAVEAAKDEALQKTDIYKKLAVETVELTRNQVKNQIEALNALLEDGTISGEIKDRVQAQLNSLQFALKIGVDQANLDNLKNRVKLLKDALNAKDELGNSIISKDETRRILTELSEIQQKINEIDGDADGAVKWGDKVAQNFDYLKDSSTEVAQGLSNDLAAISGSFSELSNALGGVNTNAGYVLDTLAQLTKAGSDAAGAFASFATGDIIGGITKTVSAVAGLFSIGKKVKEMNAAARKEVADFYAKAIAGEREYQALLRQRERNEVRRGKNTYNAIIAELELLKDSAPELQATYDRIFASIQNQQYVADQGFQHGTWFRKAKTWDIMASLFGSDFDNLQKLDLQGKLTGQVKIDFDELKRLRDELDKAGVDVEELQKQLRELLTGTSVSGLADQLAQLFENGKFAAEDFGKTFEEIMQTAFSNSFKLKVLEDGLTPFYNEFADLFVDGIPSEGDIDLLRAKYLALGEDFAEKFKQWEKITGISFTDTNVVPVEVELEIDSDFERLQDDIFRLFQDGTLTAEAFGDNVTAILKNAVLEGLRAEIFAEGLKTFYDKLNEFKKSGKPLTEAQIAELKADYFAFVEMAKAKLEDLEKVTGLTFAQIVQEEVGGVAKVVDSELQSIEDSVLGIFANAENAAEEFGENFNSIIKKQILNALRDTALRDQLADFYEQFKKLSESGDGLTEEKIAELRMQYDKIIRDAQTKLAEYSKITGISFDPEPAQTALANSISRAITEETGSELAGIWRAQYDETKRQGMTLTKMLAIAQQSLELFIKIEQNTYRTASNTDGISAKLDTIASNTRTVSNQTARDLGLKLPA